MPKVALVASLAAATGNCVTAHRIAAYLSAAHDVALCDAAAPPPPPADLDLLVALHCWHGGRHLLPPQPPRARSILILGGTDVHGGGSGGSGGGGDGEERARAMAAALRAASALVAFSASMAAGLPALLAAQGEPPAAAAAVLRKVRLVPQGVPAAPAAGLGAPRAAPCALRALLGLPPATPLVLLVAGLREVKDPLFALPAFSAWAGAQPQPAPALVVVGPPLEAALAARVAAHAGVDAARGRPHGGANRVFYLPHTPQATLLAYTRAADALLNTSRSEGQSQALLEAMGEGTPVVARDVPGNAAVVAHGETGLLFDSPEAAVRALAACLVGSEGSGGGNGRWRTALGERLARSAHAYVSEHHSEARERASWLALAQEVLAQPQAAAEAAAAAAAAQPAPSYVPFSLCSLTPEQLRVSARVKAGLQWMGAATPEALGPVLAVPRAPAGAQQLAQPGLARQWGAAGDADCARWPSQPYIYDFSGSGSGSGAPSGASPAELLRQPNITHAPSGEVARLGWGRFREDRVIYTSEHFTGGAARGLARTLHIGVDLEAPAGTPVRAPLPGRVHSVGIDRSELGYGPTLVLEHRMETVGGSGEGSGSGSGGGGGGGSRSVDTFYTLYGHLSAASLFDGGGAPLLAPGAAVARGQVVGALGSPVDGENGGWWPHTHLQVMVEQGLGGWRGDYPGVCRAVDWPAYRVLMLDPNLLLRCPWVAPEGWQPLQARSQAVSSARVLEEQ